MLSEINRQIHPYKLLLKSSGEKYTLEYRFIKPDKTLLITSFEYSNQDDLTEVISRIEHLLAVQKRMKRKKIYFPKANKQKINQFFDNRFWDSVWETQSKIVSWMHQPDYLGANIDQDFWDAVERTIITYKRR
tara:strand:+ start:29 stop:427 length:399 start_codon:yes stop_codon:yes gene_type:complete